MPPSVSFTNLPASQKIHKLDNNLIFKFKATDSDPGDATLVTNFYLNGTKVTNFKVSPSATVSNGNLQAVNGREYQITINNKNTYVPSNLNSFKLKVVTIDSANQQATSEVTLSNYNTTPTISFTSLPTENKVSKGAQTLNIGIKATDADTAVNQNLTTEFYLDTGAGFKKVNSFTANGTAINNGLLTAINGTVYAITMNKTALVPINVNSFKLKAVTKDASNAQSEVTETLLHFNAPSVIEFYNPVTTQVLADGQNARKSNNIFEFGLKVSKADLAEDDTLETELYVGFNSVYQKIDEFTINGVVNTTGKYIAQNGIGYTINFNKALFVPLYANDFKIRAVVKDSLGEQWVKELCLYILQTF
jgi:hypothetical protein